MRCLLFVPGDSARKLAKASTLQVDALIVDLEDAVAASERPRARLLTQEFVAQHPTTWVRINPWKTPDADADLDSVMAARPAGLVLPKASSPRDVLELAKRLDDLESEHDIQHGSTKILSLCTERVQALFSLGDYAGVSDRLLGLSWGAEDLSSELGARANRDSSGAWLPPYEMARSMCLFAARAAEVLAFDTVYTNFRDRDGLRCYAENAARDGFDGMLAIHPAQVDIIQAVFSPTDAEIAEAREIVALFESNAGVVAHNGKMLDRPHLLQAQRLLAKC